MPGVSIIIPCYNHAGTLPRAVASALAQSDLLEIVIVDDHSADASLETARRLAGAEARIRVVQTACNMGPGGARNAGVRASRGAQVCFLDADDELLGDFTRQAMNLKARAPDMRFVKGDMEFFDPVKGYVLPQDDSRYRAVVLSSSCGMLIERDAFLGMGGFSEDPVFRGPRGGEDAAFMEAVMKHFQPIGRVEGLCYRVWSLAGSHLDKFLAHTRLKGESFEFVQLHGDQIPGGPLAQAMEAYLGEVARRLGKDRH